MFFRLITAFQLLLLVLCVSAFPTNDSFAQAGGSWTSFRGNSANTGATANPGPLFPDRQWMFDTEGFSYSSPAITDNAIYIASDRNLIALDLNGDELWSVPLTETQVFFEGIEITGIVSSPAVSNSGNIYVGSLDDNIYAVSPGGSVLWSVDTGDQVFASPVIGPDGTVYIASRSGSVLALNPENGNVIWSQVFNTEFFSSPALEQGILYIGGINNRLYALNATTGISVWTTQNFIQEDIISSPAVFNGVVYVGSTDNRLYAFDALSGNPEWAQPFNGNDVFVSSPAIGVNNGALYACSFDGTVYAINRANGSLRWSYDAGDIIAASPIVDGNGRIFIATLDGTLHVLEDTGSQGVVRWTYALGAPTWASPAISTDNVLYVASSGTTVTPGRVLAIGPSLFDVGLLPSPPRAGEDLEITVRLAGTQDGASGTLYYRSAGSSEFTPVPFSLQITIPGNEIVKDGFAYYIEGPQGTFPSNSPVTRPATSPVFTQQIASEADLFPRIYKMISVPFELSDTSIESVLIDDFGPYDPSRWRIAQFNGLDYVEFPNFDDSFEPGKAFFLVTSSETQFTIENATSVDTSQPFGIELAPGWNQVGNPFGFPVSWNDVTRDPSIVSNENIAFWNGAQWIQGPDFSGDILPWEGYLIYNNSTSTAAIQFQPLPTTNATLSKSVSEPGRIRLTASLDGSNLIDNQNWVGFHPDASAGNDALDIPEAPPFGDHIRLSIRSTEDPMALDYKPQPQHGTEWALYLTASTDKPLSQKHTITLSLDKNEYFPKDFDLALVDEDHGYAQLLTKGTVSIQWDPLLEGRNLSLITGTTEYINSRIQSIPLAPESFSLDQNFPNPFQQQTTIRYQLSQRADVSLIVYNALGQEIQTLSKTVQSPGSFEAAWDGKDSAGRDVPSGIYFYRLYAGDYQATGRMTLIR